ncbi:MAG: DUF3313 domain-containing protein [Kiritimatiellae bacterium]|nr:DUF3313 domain-containing protein [Kiritimatiellia bacterium]
MIHNKLLMISLASVIPFLGACNSMKLMSTYKDAGFLGDYSNLRPDPDHCDAAIWIKPGFSLKNYDKILLDNIIVWYRDKSDYKGVDASRLKILTDYFHAAITHALGADYPVVTEPGPGVLRIRVAITEMVPTKPSMSVVVLVLPYATIADLAASMTTQGGFGSSPYVGDAAIESEFLDSVTSERVVAYVDRRIGKKYDYDFHRGPVKFVSQAAVSYVEAYTFWSYTKEAFDYWARELRTRLDKAHGKAPVKKKWW